MNKCGRDERVRDGSEGEGRPVWSQEEKRERKMKRRGKEGREGGKEGRARGDDCFRVFVVTQKWT